MVLHIPTSDKFAMDSSETIRKISTLNGVQAIEYVSCNQHYEDATYSDECRLLITIRGALNLTHGTSRYMVANHQMVFLKNSTLIGYQTIGEIDEEHRTEFIIFSISYDLMKEFSVATQLNLASKTDSQNIVVSSLHANILKFAHSLTAYLEDSILADDTLVKIKLIELLYSLKAYNGSMLEHIMDVRKELRPNITMVMEDNFMNPLSINQLARLAGRSLSSFRRDFISVYNMPPSQWIRERRLKKSREFLLNTNMSVTDICYTLGFENISHFSRLFKSHFGHSPSEYRLQLFSA